VKSYGYYIQLDQYLTADEAVDGIRIDSLQLYIEQDAQDPGILNFDFNDDKDMKIIDLDSSYIYRYQEVNEHSMNQIMEGTIDPEAYDRLKEICGRTLTFLFHDVFFNSSDEQVLILDSLSSMVRSQIIDAGIDNPATIDAIESQVVSHILKSISIIYFNEDQDDLFGEDIIYDRGFSDLVAPGLYNGNISGIKWQTTQNPGIRGYGFQYDELNQMLQANYAEYEGSSWTRNPGRYNVSDISYDHNGNIQNLDRNGLTGTQGGNNTFGQMDGLTYTYDGNKLQAVQDDIANSGVNNNDFKDNSSYGTVEYEYDNNGNLLSDDNKGILSISYNHLNLPEEIVFSTTKKINYLYAADGTKLKETITDGEMTHTFDYCSNLVYEDGELSFLLTPAGRAILTEQEHEYVYEYFLRDHLGNIRVVFGDPDRNHEAEVIQENHYYPFGMTMGGLNFAAGLENRYLYQGKETTGDFSLWWSDFHARRFDSQLGRWHVPDLAGQFASPYVGMGNNPMVAVDPDGRWAVGGRNQELMMYRQAQQVVAQFLKQLMESFSEEEAQREFERLEMLDYAQRHGVGQGQDDGDLNSDGTGEDDPPGGKNISNEGDNSEYSVKKTIDWDKLYIDAEGFFIVAAMFDAQLPFGDMIGAFAYGGAALGRALFGVSKLTSTFFEGAQYSSKVISQMNNIDDLYHVFPICVDGYAIKFGKAFTQIGTDGNVYNWLRLEGSWAGKSGYFEYIKDANGIINHRYFVPF